MRRRATDYWALYRSLEKTIDKVEQTADSDRAIRVIMESLVSDYQDSLGITGGRLYRREDADYELVWQNGPADAAAPAGYRIPASYEIVRATRNQGVLIADHQDPLFDPAIEGPLNVDTFAAIAVGDGGKWLISFSLDPEAEHSHVLYCLNTVRHVIAWKLERSIMAGQILHVAEIQSSLFPREDPDFPGYEIHGASRPSEAVGGDVFDFLRLGQSLLGILIADSSGHGLPAALHARDVVTGMRIGMEKDLKITRVIEKLNRVIHQTSIYSKFVSLCYGELDRYGNFIYCNAGHVPVLRLRHGIFYEMSRGGPVLGPSSDAEYERGHTALRRGDLLAFYTDGITEAHDPAGEEFGLRRLKRIVAREADHTATEIVDAVMDEVARFAPDDPLRDDQTVVIVRRTAARQRARR
ncbi:MAG: PP2C family protein-serine/threonine phosphatase [Acidobacteriota bacterium]